MVVVAGVDVGNANLDVSVSEGPVLRFDNTARGITRLLKHLMEQDATMTVCESTGGYERLLVGRLRKAEIAVRVAHPSRVRAFARACGYEAKTDPRDAQVLSRYGQVFPDADTLEPEPGREELRDLLRRRRQLVEQRVQELNRLDKGVSFGVAKSTKRHIAWLDKEIAQLDKEYQEALQSSAPLARRRHLRKRRCFDYQRTRYIGHDRRFEYLNLGVGYPVWRKRYLIRGRVPYLLEHLGVVVPRCFVIIEEHESLGLSSGEGLLR